ncbi:MAG TPA: ATP-binding protein [Ktedonobacteraceae bacterium]|nr:ATP-binding protein [Ktedonobacteraceae bacterium]
MEHENATKTTVEQSTISLEQEASSTIEQNQERVKTGEEAQTRQSEQELLLEQASDTHILIQKRSFGSRLRRWFISSSFTPQWLPAGLRHPLFGYLIALLLQTIAILATLYLDNSLQKFVFPGSLEVLAIALVALSWGVGPSVIATLVGTCLFDYIVLPPSFNWAIQDPKDVYQLLLFVLIGLAISIVASQTERARRRAERLADSLTKEHARLEAIIETVPDVVTIYDKRGRMIHNNDFGSQSRIFDPGMQNRSLEELVKAGEAFTLAGKAVKLEDLPVAHALRGTTVASTEIRFLDSHGLEHFLSISAAPLRNMRGKVDGVVSVTRDLSALHQSEREAANRALELEAIFESITDGLFVADKTGKIIRSNAAFQEIIGFTGQKSFLALTLEERYALLHVRDEQDHPLPYEEGPTRRILRGEELKDMASMDLRLHNLHGRDLLLNVSGTPLYNREGELIAALCICHDVTERRKLEQRTHDALDALLTMAEALIVHDDGELDEYDRTHMSRKIALRMARLTSRVLGCSRVSIFLSEATTGLLHPVAVVGLSPDEEANWWNFTEKLDLSIHDPAVTQLTTRLQNGEILLLNLQEEPFKKWTYHSVQTSTCLVAPMNAGHLLIGLLALGHETPDYTYSQEELALAGAISQLLALVFERERLLREQAEAQATELALRTANQRMEEFLGMVSHELKTPLTSIKGNTQLAIRQLKTSMQAFERIMGLYEATEQQSRRLNRLVDDLLDVSRTQSGRLELIPGPCDLREIVHEAIQEQQKMWPNRTITLEMDEATVLPLNADADRIAQVISNYLINALKYSDSDRPVAVKAVREGQQAYLAVHDEGPGLPTDEQERIWGQFHRVPGIEIRSSSHTSQAGLGLGLYISKMIIEGQQGEVGVQSTPGDGSTFWFRLPLRPKPKD